MMVVSVEYMFKQNYHYTIYHGEVRVKYLLLGGKFKYRRPVSVLTTAYMCARRPLSADPDSKYELHRKRKSPKRQSTTRVHVFSELKFKRRVFRKGTKIDNEFW
jgi:hypothetical protein